MKLLKFSFVLFLFISCSHPENDISSEKSYENLGIDFDQISENGVLKALVVFSPINYYLSNGKEMGFEYELLSNFAETYGLKLEMVRVSDIDSIILKLLSGEGDIIAHGLTITAERKENLLFTDYHNTTRQLLVQRKPDNWRNLTLDQIDLHLNRNIIDLIGDTISVRKESSYYPRLLNIMDEIGGKIIIDTVDGGESTESIIIAVANKELNMTVADESIAELLASYYSILDCKTAISLDQAISWGVRKDSEELAEKINQWLKKIKISGFYNVVYNKYYNKNRFKKNMKDEYFSLKTGKISKYDQLIKKYSKSIDWDWRLVSSIVYQESRFDHSSKSSVGAKGLMQIMPSTAKQMGIKNHSDSENLRIGIKYLKHIFDMWPEVDDSIQKIKFTLASYNCGYNHVKDAQILAEKLNFNPLIWDENVEECLLKLSNPKYYNREYIKYGYVRSIEPYHYVRDIFERFYNYEKFVTK